MPELSTKRKYRENMARKQDQPDLLYGVLGDGKAVVNVPGRVNYVYVQIGNQVREVYNVQVPATYGIPVSLGVDPTDAQRGLQVLGIAGSHAQYADVPTESGYAPAKRYQWMANDGGEDPVYIALRQFLPLRVSPAGGLYVSIYPGMIKLDSGWIRKSFEVINLSSYVPTTPGKAKLILITINLSGESVVTEGDEVDVAELTDFYDSPETPVNTKYDLAFVRLYYGQDGIYESRINTDLFDLRMPYMEVLTTIIDSLLSRNDNDWLNFDEDTGPLTDDWLLSEKGASSGVNEGKKKKIKIGNLPGGASGGSISVQGPSGTPNVNNVTLVRFEDCLVSDVGGGEAEVIPDPSLLIQLDVTKETITSRKLLYDNTLSEDGIWDVDLSALDNWSASITDLEIIFDVKSNLSTTAYDRINIYFNDDTTLANYIRRRMYHSNTGFATNQGADTMLASINTIDGAAGDSFSWVDLVINGINDTASYKKLFATHNIRQDSYWFMGFHTIEWFNTNAITKIKFMAESAPSNHFEVGSRIRIYGVVQQDVVTDVTIMGVS